LYDRNCGNPKDKFDPLSPAFRDHYRSLQLTQLDLLYHSMLVIHSNHEPISYRFRDKWRLLSNRSLSFPNHVYT